MADFTVQIVESRGGPAGAIFLVVEAFGIAGLAVYYTWGSMHELLSILAGIGALAAYVVLSVAPVIKYAAAIAGTIFWAYEAYRLADYWWPGDLVWAIAFVVIAVAIVGGSRYSMIENVT